MQLLLGTDRRTMAHPKGALPKDQIKQPTLNTFITITKSVSWRLHTHHRGIQKGGFFWYGSQQSLWDHFRWSLSRSHCDHTGRMECHCVRVSFLSATIEGLLCLFPPCITRWDTVTHTYLLFFFPSPVFLLSFRLLCIITYKADYTGKQMITVFIHRSSLNHLPNAVSANLMLLQVVLAWNLCRGPFHLGRLETRWSLCSIDCSWGVFAVWQGPEVR